MQQAINSDQTSVNELRLVMCYTNDSPVNRRYYVLDSLPSIVLLVSTHVKKFSRKSLCESMLTLDGNPNQMGRQIVWKSMLRTEIHSSSMESIRGNRFPFDFWIHPNQ